MNKLKNTFWNDEDGFTIKDFISVVLVMTFSISGIISCLYLTFLSYTNQNAEYVNRILDLLDVLSYPVLIVITGYFGSNICDKYIKRK